MSTLIKGIVGTCTVGGACGGGYGLYRLLSDESIKSIQDKLTSDGFTLLEDSQDHTQHWTNSLEQYKLVAKATSPFKFEDFTGVDGAPKQTPDAITKFKQLCKETIEKTTFEDADYNKAKKWCVIPKTAKEILQKEGFTPLNTIVKDGATNPDKATWTNKVTKYIATTNTNKITKPDWEADGVPTAADTAGIKKFIEQCEKLHNTKTHEEHYEAILEKAKEWCAIKSSKV